LVPNANQLNLDGDGQGDACDLDDDNDKVYDIAEQNCGGNSLNAGIRPERIDLAGNQNGTGGDSEPLPPGAAGYDCDGDGFIGSAETQITTSDQDLCGSNGWPADLVSSGASTNKLDLTDLASFVAPVRHLGTSPGDQAFDPRWDLVPGSTVGNQRYGQHARFRSDLSGGAIAFANAA
jgi:hypothetical protein